MVIIDLAVHIACFIINTIGIINIAVIVIVVILIVFVIRDEEEELNMDHLFVIKIY